MKYVVCYSGGHSSAIVAIEAVRKYGSNNVILLNHDICNRVEDQDIKRFKNEVADYLGIKITYANMPGWEDKDQFDVCIEAKAFKVGNGTELCTNRLKTRPFHQWLKDNYPTGGITLLYGFDPNEKDRINRRDLILNDMGYKTYFPLTWKHRSIYNVEELGIKRPATYQKYRHANCKGCLKAGKQQWYITYCEEPEIWEKAKYAESVIGYSILKNTFLHELEDEFEFMKSIGIEPTEKIISQSFWADTRKRIKNYSIFELL